MLITTSLYGAQRSFHLLRKHRFALLPLVQSLFAISSPLVDAMSLSDISDQSMKGKWGEAKLKHERADLVGEAHH